MADRFRTVGRPRVYRYWHVILFYTDGGWFLRMYPNREKAVAFADRQKKCPLVKTARVTQAR
jgi:hypothetical protein